MSEGPRISVIGNSGSGKTTVGRALALRLGVPFVEMDAFRHGPGWTETPDEQFRRLVADAAAGDAWVIDGNYTAIVRDAVWERATTVVWLDYERHAVMWQVIRRSLGRAITKRELWNGNREQWRFWVRADHPIRWAWAQHHRKRVRDEAMQRDPRWSHISFVRLRSRADTRRFLRGLSGRPTLPS